MNAETLLWASAAITAYAYVGYPLLLIALRPVFARPVQKADVLPSVSVVIPIHNEAAVIAAKIENALRLDYPERLIDVAVLSDGSTDGSAEVATRAAVRLGAAARVRVVEHAVNRGKVAVINDIVPTLAGEILVFTDATAMFATNAIRSLVRSFADPRVGAVGGVYRVQRPEQAATGSQEDFYWKYETFVKEQEAAMGSVLGAHGQIYAVRRALYPFPAPGTINDDYVIPLRIAQKGFRVAYDAEAVVYEDAREMTGFGRRVRIMAGNVQQLREIGGLLSPLRAGSLFGLISHKLLRLVVPFAMLATLLANVSLLDRDVYRLVLAVQGVFYALALAGAAWPLTPKLLRLPYYFCMVNAAVFAGMYHALTGRRTMRWS